MLSAQSLRYKKVILLFVWMFLTSISALSQQTLWVGQSYRFDVTSSVVGLTANTSWSSNGGYVSLSGSGFYRDITVTQYFSETATVTCEWDYKLTSSSKYTHTKREVRISCRDNQVSISPTSMTLSPGETQYVSYRHQFNNQYTSAANAYFQSTNPSIVQVDERTGKVHAVSPGTAYVNVYSKISSTSPYCLINVQKISPTSVHLPSNITMTVDESRTLTPTLTPNNSQAAFKWVSSDTNIATVSSTGTVSAKKHGTTVITVKTDNGLSASCVVTVNKSKLHIQSSKSGGLFSRGEKLELFCNKSEAQIFYTMDSSIPTNKSLLYNRPISLDNNLNIKAIAIHPDYLDSDVLSLELDVTDMRVMNSLPLSEEGYISDIHLPYVEFNKILSDKIKKESIDFKIDGRQCDFTPSVIDRRIYLIPNQLDEYRGSHICSILVEPYAVNSLDGNPNQSYSHNWKTVSHEQRYSSAPTEIYAGNTVSAYICDDYTLHTFGGWPKERGCFLGINKTFENVKQLAAEGNIVAHIDCSNNLWLAGSNGYFFPYSEDFIKYETNVIDVAYANEKTLFFLKGNGDLYGVGSDRFKQLTGLGNKKIDTGIETIYYADKPVLLMKGVKKVVAADRNCAVIKSDGTLWMWGEYDFFDHLVLSTPQKIADDVKQASISDSRPVAFVKKDNTGWYVDNKTLATHKIGENISYICGSIEYGAYITTEGKLYAWGINDHGQIGDGSVNSYPYSTPDRASFVMDNVIQVSKSGGYTLALTSSGEVYGWGANSYYRLVRDKSENYNQITPLLLFTPIENPIVQDIIIPKEITVEADGRYVMPLQTIPSNGVFSDIRWTASDENIISIDDQGILSPSKLGSANVTITLTTIDGNEIKKNVKVNIIAKGQSTIAEVFSDSNHSVELYNLQGIHIKQIENLDKIKELKPDIYIIKQGTDVQKILVK